MKFAACTMYFSTGFHFMCSLALCCEVLLYGKINDMLIWFNAKNIIRQFNLSAGFLSVYFKNFYLHYLSFFAETRHALSLQLNIIFESKQLNRYDQELIR